MPAPALAALAVLLGVALLGRARGLARRGAVAHRPADVSVVVPARDEAASLPALLASIAQLHASPREVIVVDDGSTDATAQISARAGARVRRAPDPPPGWIGKSWACWTGAGEASGDVLLFVDADVVLAPDALDRMLATHASGLLSVQPFHRTRAAYESLSAPFNLVSAMGSGAFAVVGVSGAATAFGPCLLTTRADYLAVGGHAGVAGDVVEDIALARRYREHGLPVDCRVGDDAVAFRMYPSGVGQLLEGWTKNLAAGAGSARVGPVVAAVLAVAAALAVAVGVVTDPSPATATSYAVVAAATGVALRRLGRFRWWAWALHPLTLLVFVGVFVRSAWRTHVRRSVSWRGRTVVLGPHRGEVVREPRPPGRDSVTRTAGEDGWEGAR